LDTSIQAGRSGYRFWKILSAIMLLSAIGGCIGRDSKLETEVPIQALKRRIMYPRSMSLK